MGMKRLLWKDKFLNIAGVLLVLGFVIRLAADYFKYQNSFGSAPFSVSIIFRSIEFLLPAIICFVAASYIKKLGYVKE